MDDQRLGDEIADAHARVERGEGVLENHLHVAAHGLAFVAAEARQIAPADDDVAAVGHQPASALAVVDLPQPDSPTSASVSLGAIEKLTPSTA